MAAKPIVFESDEFMNRRETLDVLFVVPLSSDNLRYHNQESLGLGYLAAVLRRYGYNVGIFHPDLYDISLNRAIEIVNRKTFRIIGFSVIQRSIENTVTMIKQLRHRLADVHITLGGFYPTLAADEILEIIPEVNSVISGEGETTFLELTEKVLQNKDWRDIDGIIYKENEKIVRNPPRSLIKDLDTIPFPERDTLGQVIKKGGNPYVISSRGCYSQCSFCSVRSFFNKVPGAKWRARSAVNLVDEMEELVKRHNISYLGIQDDNVFGIGKKQQRIFDIAEEIKKRKLGIKFSMVCRVSAIDKEVFRYLKEVGLAMVFIGIESMNQDALDIYNKQTTVEQNKKALQILDELKIFSYPHVIMFNPYTKIDHVKTDLKFIRSRVVNGYGPFFNMASSAVALQIDTGTPLYHSVKEEDWVTKIEHQFEYKIKNKKVENLRQLFQYAIKLSEPLYNELGKTGHKSIGMWNYMNLTHLNFLEGLINAVETTDMNLDETLQSVSQTYLQKLEKLYNLFKKQHPDISSDKTNSITTNQDTEKTPVTSPLDCFALKSPEEVTLEIKEMMSV